MVIEFTLTKEQFQRLMIPRHFQRPSFYFFALAASAITVYAIMHGPLILLWAAWPPFFIYLVVGVVSVIRASNRDDLPFFLHTRYELSKNGVDVQTPVHNTNLPWDSFVDWGTMAQCYLLMLDGGAFLAIPKDAIAEADKIKFESFLKGYIRS